MPVQHTKNTINPHSQFVPSHLRSNQSFCCIDSTHSIHSSCLVSPRLGHCASIPLDHFSTLVVSTLDSSRFDSLIMSIMTEMRSFADPVSESAIMSEFGVQPQPEPESPYGFVSVPDLDSNSRSGLYLATSTSTLIDDRSIEQHRPVYRYHPPPRPIPRPPPPAQSSYSSACFCIGGFHEIIVLDRNPRSKWMASGLCRPMPLQTSIAISTSTSTAKTTRLSTLASTTQSSHHSQSQSQFRLQSLSLPLSQPLSQPQSPANMQIDAEQKCESCLK